jgi:hypothetical protein
MLKILHIAPSFCSVPYDFYKMHNAVGDQSKIVTLHKNEESFLKIFVKPSFKSIFGKKT